MAQGNASQFPLEEPFIQHPAFCAFHPDICPISHPQQKAYRLTLLDCWQPRTSSKAF